MNIDASVIESFAPMVAMLATFGMPVAIVFIAKHFKLRNRELDAEIEARRFWNEKERAQFQARIERIEAVLFQRAGALPDRDLLESPPAAEAGVPVSVRRDPLRDK
ncbi:MAG: hypothetical protein NVSMB23_24330 [Myxococcales bacterium]